MKFPAVANAAVLLCGVVLFSSTVEAQPGGTSYTQVDHGGGSIAMKQNAHPEPDTAAGHSEGHDFQRLIIEQGTVHSRQGFPVASTTIVNPTDSALEFRATASFVSAANLAQSVAMVMPLHEGMKGDDRLLVRIMPHSNIRLTAPLGADIAVGNQKLIIRLALSGRKTLERKFAVHVDADAFPALGAKVATFHNGLSVSPAQIELGTVSGTRRLVGIHFANDSAKTQTLKLAVRTLAGEVLPGVHLSSSKVTVPPGQASDVKLMLRSSGSNSQSQYGTLEIRAESDSGTCSSQSLPVALLRSPVMPAALSISNVSLSETGERQAFRLSVVNHGKGYVPLHGTLILDNGQSTPIQQLAGYGRWLKPGEITELEFVPENVIPAGEYQLELELKTREQHAPEVRTTTIRLPEQE